MYNVHFKLIDILYKSWIDLYTIRIFCCCKFSDKSFNLLKLNYYFVECLKQWAHLSLFTNVYNGIKPHVSLHLPKDITFFSLLEHSWEFHLIRGYSTEEIFYKKQQLCRQQLLSGPQLDIFPCGEMVGGSLQKKKIYCSIFFRNGVSLAEYQKYYWRKKSKFDSEDPQSYSYIHANGYPWSLFNFV